jgi:hypothetical protein
MTQRTTKRRARPDYKAHIATVEQLWRLDPDRADALITLAEFALKEEQAKVSAARGIRGRLLSRLQAVHDCPEPKGGGFVQLQASASGAKSWRCEGCGKVVTLEGSRS